MFAALIASAGGGFTEKISADDVPPPGDGVKTVTCVVPRLARSLAGMSARNWLALTYVVGRLLPFHRTIDAVANREPDTVSEKPAPPTMAAAGDNDAMSGAGLIDGSTMTGALVAARV